MASVYSLHIGEEAKTEHQVFTHCDWLEVALLMTWSFENLHIFSAYRYTLFGHKQSSFAALNTTPTKLCSAKARWTAEVLKQLFRATRQDFRQPTTYTPQERLYWVIHCTDVGRQA